MEDLYSISRVLFIHKAATEFAETDDRTVRDDDFFDAHCATGKKVKGYVEQRIDSEKFKELLLSMPPDDIIENFHESFKISKEPNSIRISIFWFHKYTKYIRGKHQIEKRLKFTRYIIKINKNNFYVSSETFADRKRKTSLVQNYIRHTNIADMVEKLVSIIYRNEFGEGATERLVEHDSGSTVFKINKKKGITLTDFITEEFTKIKNVLSSELDIPITTRYGRLQPKNLTERYESLEMFFTGAILEWFSRKNNIKIRYFWLLKLMAHQYFTKEDLKKSNNDYLQTYLDYYHLTSNSVQYIKRKLDQICKKEFSCQNLSIYERIFNIYEFNGIVDSYPIYTGDAFALQNPNDRKEFGKFVDHLGDNKQLFENYINTEDENIFLVGHPSSFINMKDIIQSATLFHWIGVELDYSKLMEMLADHEEFNVACQKLIADKNEFVIQKFPKKYKKNIEIPFVRYGTKWQIKLYHKNDPLFITDPMNLRHINAYLQQVKCDNMIGVDIEYKPYKHKVVVRFNYDDLLNYFEQYNISSNPLSDSFRYQKGARQWIMENLTTYVEKRRDIPRKKPDNNKEVMECVLQQVYNIFSHNGRYFNIDNQILLPILRDRIEKDEYLNKYLKITTQ